MTLTLNQGAWQVALIMRHVGPMPRVAPRSALPFFIRTVIVINTVLLFYYCRYWFCCWYFSFTLTLALSRSVIIKLFVINELSFSSTRL